MHVETKILQLRPGAAKEISVKNNTEPSRYNGPLALTLSPLTTPTTTGPVALPLPGPL